MKKNKKMILTLIILIVTIALALIPTFASALGTIHPEDYKPGPVNPDDLKPVTDIVNPIIAVLRYGGIAIAIIVLIILGIKYMVASVSERAEYKKSMIAYIIGVAVLVSTTQLIAIIAEIVNGVT